MHYSRISGPYPLDASVLLPIPPGCDNQKYLQILPNVYCGKNHPLLQTIDHAYKKQADKNHDIKTKLLCLQKKESIQE